MYLFISWMGTTTDSSVLISCLSPEIQTKQIQPNETRHRGEKGQEESHVMMLSRERSSWTQTSGLQSGRMRARAPSRTRLDSAGLGAARQSAAVAVSVRMGDDVAAAGGRRASSSTWTRTVVYDGNVRWRRLCRWTRVVALRRRALRRSRVSHRTTGRWVTLVFSHSRR